MKFLLFSDNHRDRESVKKIIKDNPDLDHYISLGDSEMKEHELTKLNVYGVKGNYPFEPDFPKELTFEFEGLRMCLTHGHLYGVKMGITRLLNHGIHNNIDIICYGHTHRAVLQEIEDMILINPGALSSNRVFGEASYCLLEITKREIKAQIKNINGEVLHRLYKQR